MAIGNLRDEVGMLEADLLRARLRQIARQESYSTLLLLLPVLALLLLVPVAIADLSAIFSVTRGSIDARFGGPILALALAIIAYACWRAESLRRAELDMRLSQLEMEWGLSDRQSGTDRAPAAST
jgi:hypothetical protein